MGETGETAVLVTQPNGKIVQQGRKQRKSEWNSLLLIIGLATTFGVSVPVGYNIGVINSPATYIKDWCNQTIIERYGNHLSSGSLEMLLSAIVSIFLVGGAIGSLGGAWLADRFGRKGSYLISGLTFLIGAVFFLFCRVAKSVEMLMIGRLIVGLASGLTTATVPMYLMELAPLALRGTMGVMCAMGVTGGVVVGQVFSLQAIFGTEEQWHYALGFYAILVIICLIPSYSFPESPKYLFIVRGDKDAAADALRKLRGDRPSVINKELEDMETYLTAKVQTQSLLSVICDRSLLLPLIIVCAFQGGQQLSGINAVFYYSVSIFEKAGLTRADAEWANLGAGCLNLSVSLFGPILMSKVNRRPLMLMSSLASAIFLFALMFVIHYINVAKWLPIASIICVFSYIFFFQFGLGPIPYFIGSELFDVAPRPAAMSLGSLSSWACNFIVGMAFPSLQTAWGAFVFLPFSITCLILFLLTKFYLPETRGRDPLEVAPLVANGFRSRPVL